MKGREGHFHHSIVNIKMDMEGTPEGYLETFKPAGFSDRQTKETQAICDFFRT